MLTTPGTPVSSSPGPSSTSNMSPAGAQHRLMLKQTPIDVWSLREQLGLASAVLRSGDQNWVSVSRQMKPFSEEGRPHDWFSQKNCALQYNLLLEKVDTPRRKRGDKMEATETPGQAIVRRLKAERLKELKQVIEKQSSQIKQYEQEVQLLNDPATSEEKVDLIEKVIEKEDQEEAERQKAHAVWLAEREEKKMAIQAALKAHTSKLPLKGAAASAYAQASIIRRLSAQSERTSFSDVDSPISHHPVIENILSKMEVLTPEVITAVESTSPLLSSLLKSPTTSSSTLTAPPTNLDSPVSTIENNVVEEKVVVDEEMEVDSDIVAVDTNQTEPEQIEPEPELQVVVESSEIVAESNGVVENGTEPEIDVEIVTENKTKDQIHEFVDVENKIEEEEQTEPKIEENDSTEHTNFDLVETPVEILIENGNCENLIEKLTEPEVDKKCIEESIVNAELSDVVADKTNEEADVTGESSTGIVKTTAAATKPEEEAPSNGLCQLDANIIIKTEESEDISATVEENTEALDSVTGKDQIMESDLAEIKVENVFEDEIKINRPSEDLDEDKPLTFSSEIKRLTRTSLSSSTSSKSGRRPRKQSDLLLEDEGGEDTPIRRETRSKKTSERSEEHPSGIGCLETASEESPLPPPSTGIRETRRSAAKKAQVIAPSSELAASDDLDSSKEEAKEETTTQNAASAIAENRRVSRLKEKEALGNRKGRRGSGATTTSRSSSPVMSGDESESDLLLPRATRTRRKSGRTVTTSTTGATPPPSELSNVPPMEETPMSSMPPSPDVTHSIIAEAEEEWVRLALNILSEVTNHKSFGKLIVDEREVDKIAFRPCNVDTMKKGLEEGSIKSVHEFYTSFMLMLVNIVMSNSSESEMYGCAQSLYNEFNETIQEVLMPLESTKSVPTTPIMSTPTPTPSKNVKNVDDLPKKTRGEKRDATSIDEIVKRKRGSLSSSLASEESSSAPGTPSNKKRKRN